MGPAAAKSGPTIPRRAQAINNTGHRARAMFFLALGRLLRELSWSVRPELLEVQAIFSGWAGPPGSGAVRKGTEAVEKVPKLKIFET